MNSFQAATARRDRRGMHIASERAKAITTIALAKKIYGPNTKRTRRLKQIMGEK